MKHVVENSHKIIRCYGKRDDEANLCSYRDDILHIAYHSRKEGKLVRIDFAESSISEYDNDMNVIVETTPELFGHENQSKKVECYLKEIKNTLVSKYLVCDIKGTISITEASLE